MEILLFPVQTHGRFIAANDRGLAQLGLDHRFMFRYTRGHRIQLFKQRTEVTDTHSDTSSRLQSFLRIAQGLSLYGET